MTGCILGIDPGLRGALAFYFPEAPDRVSCYDMPIAASEVDASQVAERVQQMVPDFAIIEIPGARTGQGAGPAIKFGAAYGCVRGVLGALGIRTILVAPHHWKKFFRLDSDKEKARAFAIRTFAKSASYFSRKQDHDRAEAALIALFGAKNEGA